MGGGHYDGDVAREARSTNTDVFAYEAPAAGGAAQREVHAILNPHGTERECMNTTPIVVAMDVTRSRGDDSRIIYAKLPMFLGQIELKNYVQGAAISFAAIGDATDGDKAPLQVGQFEADNRLDEVLSKIWLEEGGGGSGRESYELAAYYYARHSRLECNQEGRKGFFFFLGDEGFYPQVSKQQIESVLGRKVAGDVDAAAVFAELQEKFHVFFIYPQKSMADRRSDIDAEIRNRVLAAGGRYEGVDIRASLIWDNRNDLDLHVMVPSGEHIYYGAKRSQCGGWLDVDQNVSGETTKPVENVQWAKGSAPKGRYRVFVRNYRFHEADHQPTKFRVEVEINGQVQHIEKTISKKEQTGPDSDVEVLQFDYDPATRPPQSGTAGASDSSYANYTDAVILAQWGGVIPTENILMIDDPKAIVDVMLGVLAIVGGGGDLDSYLVDMKGREQLELRQDQALRTLGNLASATRMARAEVAGDLPTGGGPRRGSGSRRL